MTVWTTEAIESLKTLHSEGLSASKTSVRMTTIFGHWFTRNAIIGKVNRLGLSKPSEASKLALAPHKNRKRLDRSGERATPPPRTAYRPAKPVKRAVTPDTLEPAPKGTNQAGSGCQWIHGCIREIRSGTHQFCDHPKADGSSWCEHHHRLATNPPETRKRRKARAA